MEQTSLGKARLQAFSDIHGAPMQRYFNLLYKHPIRRVQNCVIRLELPRASRFRPFACASTEPLVLFLFNLCRMVLETDCF